MDGQFRQVGENGPEYLYVPPGSQAVVAPRSMPNEEPTLHHAVVAILTLMAKEKAAGMNGMGGARGAADSKLKGAAAGDVLGFGSGPGNPDFASLFASAFPGATVNRASSTGSSGSGYGGALSAGPNSDILALILNALLNQKQFNANLGENQRQFNVGQGNSMTQFFQNLANSQNQFNATLNYNREQANRASQEENNRLNAQIRASQAAAASGGGSSSGGMDDLQKQLANALLIAREGNANALEIARMQADTARQGQQNQFALGQAANRLTARQQLSERATRQLLGPGGNAIPSLAV